MPNRSYSPIDIPLIRYADVVLSLAECLNEQGKTDLGEPQYSYTWGGNHLYNWAIPRSEILMNENLKQNEGWID
ncbi:RagB/SusD family nutrient uptake outer membrane protein [Parabacteroides goldsteinii]|uniref:RagB/SusD family nutrient uptake outer membrane protein n=1 Tax=Parabacteroides goldsteinii TaxID=328812 RepID=UPI00241D1E3C|nr:RagB/SusD family nutrient uptake outer membrane protein [Parabacteroides goldsteinii]